MSRQRPHGNFRDPLGLVLRMLRSRDRAARAALLRAAVAIPLTPFDVLLQVAERQRLAQARPSSLPIILIVGAPRSGTTLVYQTLGRHLPVTYFNNLSALFPRSPLSACRLFDRFLSVPAADTHSYYGNTSSLSGPNDAFHIWNRWLGEDRYRAPQALDETAARDMRRFFDAWLTLSGRPLLNKNNRNAACMPLLASCLENAWFIVVRRDPTFIAQSLLRAREHIQGSKAIGWGLQSRDVDPGRGPQAWIDDVCDQVYGIDAQLTRDQEQVGKDRVIELGYERFCADPSAAVEMVSERIWGAAVARKRAGQELRPFPTANQPLLAPKELERVRARIGELYGTGAARRAWGKMA